MRKVSAITLIFLLLLSLTSSVWAADPITTPATGYTRAEDVEYLVVDGTVVNWGARGEDCTFLTSYALDYYQDDYIWDILSAFPGGTDTSDAYQSELYDALQNMMQAEHDKQTSYGETRYLYCYTDCLLGDYSHISSFYSGQTLSGTWDYGATWNREHTWPNSKGLNGNDENDIMMLRPTSVSENSSRGNSAYGEGSGFFDPGESVRGDCARIMLYVYVRWGNTGKMWGSSGVMESLEILLKWMEEDPVDTWEMGRNDSVQSITGVRNVFVDYPEYAWLLFGQEIPEDMTTPSGSNRHSHSYENGLCTACGAEHPNLANYKGKVISVLGDSISTFAGWIPTADGFNLEHLARYPQDDLLTDVQETWWLQLVNGLDAKLGINDSWRGATLSGGAPVTSGTTGKNAAFSNLIRIQNLGSNGTPDVIVLYGGTNDLAHVSKVGTFDPATAPTEVDLTTKKWDNLADGFLHTLLRLRHFYPDATIVALLPTYTASYYSNEKLDQGNIVMAAICQHYGIPYVDLRTSGVTADLLPDGIHPGPEGMDRITSAVMDLLLARCPMAPGEHIVHSVTHELTAVTSSLGHYKGISHGKAFCATLTGEEMAVTITMDGEDITASAYADGIITIPAVTGDIVIRATGRVKPIHEDHLQPLPEGICAGTNLWPLLAHDSQYYTVTGWGVHASGKVYSVTIPVAEGDRIWATSFGKSGENGGSMNGIRLTWFTETGVLESMSADSVYDEFTANGYLTAPAGAVAVNVVMWTGSNENALYLLSASHHYTPAVTAPTCTEYGFTTYTCPCGHSYTADSIPALGHKDFVPRDHLCDRCGENLGPCTDGNGDGLCDWCDPSAIVRGDMDGDGDVDSDDAIYLLYSTFLPEDYPVNQSGDLDGDGDTDSDDAIYLLYFTFLPDDYPLQG